MESRHAPAHRRRRLPIRPDPTTRLQPDPHQRPGLRCLSGRPDSAANGWIAGRRSGQLSGIIHPHRRSRHRRLLLSQSGQPRDHRRTDIDAVRSASHAAWNALLSRIQIGGGTPTQQQLFYTMLYRVLLHPNIWSDANGQYVGFDQAIHTMPAGHAQYANYSGWDTYHSQSQLAALLAPQESSDQAQSLLNDYAQDNLLPPWGFANSNNYVMVGDPAQAILADYYAFGATSFDTATALHDMIAQATTVNDVRPERRCKRSMATSPLTAATAAATSTEPP